jgi:magnesium-transporting ATPase (P-type)
LAIVQDKIENDFYLLGCTAIDDQLQDDVADCLENFIKTGIKVWVLTGDKIDTAKSIAFSCKLLTHEFHLLELEEQSSFEEIKASLEDFHRSIDFGDVHKKFGLIISSEELTLITKTDLIERVNQF